VGRRTAARNRVLEVFLDHIRDAGGGEVEDFMVVAPRGGDSQGVTGVAVLPLLDGEPASDAGDCRRVVLLRVFRHPIAAFTWEVPRGFVDAGEQPAAAALRELAEETGYVCEPAALHELATIEPEPGILAARTRLFVARHCRAGGGPREAEPGHAGLHVLPVAAALALARDGGVREACTLIALLRLQLEGDD
jgi:ADP-ribose pyrophosphatase